MRKHKVWRLPVIVGAVIFILSGVAVATPTTDLSQTINPGTLVTSILDDDRESVANPSVAMTAQNFSFDCQTSEGIFGSNTERVYVVNPSAATNGWTLTLAATDGVSAEWENGDSSSTFAFNDPDGTPDGCDNGQLTVDPSDSTLTADCETCSTDNISKGSSAGFASGTVDSVTLLNASDSSDDVWRGYLTDVDLSQTIPGETPADTYSINLTLTATAQ
jgi:hypothetical protein